MSSHPHASDGTDHQLDDIVDVDDSDCVNSIMPNCPNFRRLCPGVRIYRSSRPDLLTDEEAGFFRDKLNIRTIIDLRSVSEYKKATGDKLVANHYNLYKLKVPQRQYSRQETVETEPLEQQRVSRCSSVCNPDGTSSPSVPQPPSPSQQESSSTDHPHGKPSASDVDISANTGNDTEGGGQEMVERRHYLFDIFKAYPWLMFSRAPWYIQVYSIFVLLFDVIWGTGFKHFMRLYVRRVLNPQGILGQYKDMIEIGSKQICAALKLLSSPDHVPALLNCTFGKDRTGVLCALILACLGKDKTYISRNYAQSAALLEHVKDVLRDEMTRKYQLNETFITAEEQTMMDLLTHIEEKYGSMWSN
ncbi:Hypothetical predicted protein [Octopus vulgaris]|uniref:Tyrosine specific protein phosphatases domain-containing protein n=1 Tax=Octopus vulgaris TaxID=6645 RepID=A0AA36C2I2_OCTVU|nr:Hypothetical predicted protein [Octopus vulgaris]